MGDCSPGVALDVVGDMSVRPGACPSGWGPSTPSGTEILSPDAQDAPVRSSAHPAARNVPGRKRRGRAGSGEQDLQDSRGGEAARLRAGLDDVEHPDVGQLGNQAVGSPV